MDTQVHAGIKTDPSTLDIRVQGPDCEPVAAGDLRRLFAGSALTQGRLDRLRNWNRVSVLCGERIVAVATCKKTDVELQVPEMGIDATCGCSMDDVVGALLDALELAGLAGGCRRIVMVPPAGSQALLRGRGYAAITERCAGGWLEKTLI